jgi:hypothetical protein
MKAFINLRFFDLDPDEDIIKEYEQYEREVMEADVQNFAEVNHLQPELVLSIVNQYFMDEYSVTKDKIRQKLADMKLPLLQQTRLIKNILIFVKDMYDKFTAEGV